MIRAQKRLPGFVPVFAVVDLGEAVWSTAFDEPGFVALSFVCLLGLIAVFSTGWDRAKVGDADAVRQVNTRHNSIIEPVFLFINGAEMRLVGQARSHNKG